MQYQGGCHCGAVRFTVDMKIEGLLACNCSICSKKGHLLAFAPDSAFQLKSGQDKLGDYLFGPKTIHHYFCKVCGIGVFGKAVKPDGTTGRAINVRCLDAVDIEKYPVQNFDGKSL